MLAIPYKDFKAFLNDRYEYNVAVDKALTEGYDEKLWDEVKRLDREWKRKKEGLRDKRPLSWGTQTKTMELIEVFSYVGESALINALRELNIGVVYD
jgi:hypothetical protein